MIRRIQALNYRCLRYVDVALDRFHVLVGPNASGKSTLLDVVAFLADMVSGGLEAAVEKRTRNFQDLVWGRPKEGIGFELAVEFEIPEDLKRQLPEEKGFELFRYEVAIKEKRNGIRIDSERGILMPRRESEKVVQYDFFPCPPKAPDTILVGGGRHGRRTILSKSSEGRDNFNIEASEKAGKGWVTNISFGPLRSTLGNLPESPEKLPVATHIRRTLETRVKPLFLDSVKMRQASPPSQRLVTFSPDGFSLPWAIRRLRKEHELDYKEWLSHVRTALVDLKGIRVVEREDDRHAYLMLRYETDVEVPSWMVSDGTLRFLALTLIAYLPDAQNVYLLEEPENGIHPMAADSVYQSLSSVYDSQILIATHSPVVLKMAEPAEVLCLAKNDEGATHVIAGNEHPILRNWRGAVDTSALFVTGVIG